uniref:Uncharacterized protein n=1 Tax=Arundo donax TaxID=35708 RepID=A0A0A9AWV3_ARUDO
MNSNYYPKRTLERDPFLSFILSCGPYLFTQIFKCMPSLFVLESRFSKLPSSI